MVVVTGVRLPEVPVMVTVEVPTGAVLLAVNLTTLVAVAGLVPNVAVTPLGKPEAVRLMLPENVPVSTIAIVSVALAPGATERVAADGESVKLPVGTEPPQVVPFTANEVGTAFVAPFQAPLNPMPERLPPAGMLPLYGSLVTVTFAPL